MPSSPQPPNQKPSVATASQSPVVVGTVYMLCGWFGDVEWVEGIYANEADANFRCNQLWTDRASDHGPDYARGLHKFAVEPMPLLQADCEAVGNQDSEISRLRDTHKEANP